MKKAIIFDGWTPYYESKYFKPCEFFQSEIAEEYRINNTPQLWFVFLNISRLSFFLDMVRAEFGDAIIISSGFRCDLLNQLCGGAKRSYHRIGCSVDIRPLAIDDASFEKLAKIVKQYLLRECIVNKERHYIHITIPAL